jgi:hypothetical protein
MKSWLTCLIGFTLGFLLFNCGGCASTLSVRDVKGISDDYTDALNTVSDLYAQKAIPDSVVLATADLASVLGPQIDLLEQKAIAGQPVTWADVGATASANFNRLLQIVLDARRVAGAKSNARSSPATTRPATRPAVRLVR